MGVNVRSTPNPWTVCRKASWIYQEYQAYQRSSHELELFLVRPEPASICSPCYNAPWGLMHTGTGSAILQHRKSSMGLEGPVVSIMFCIVFVSRASQLMLQFQAFLRGFKSH